MRNLLVALLAIPLIHSISNRGFAQGSSLPRSTPEAQGVSSTGILEFFEAADTQIQSMHSFMLLRHGSVVAEAWWSPESADTPHVEWVEKATSKQVSNGSDPSRDWDQGYGFQFWRCRYDAFRGDGKNGQFCVVLIAHLKARK